MKKLLILILCLALFAGCVSVPANTPQGSEATAAPAVESTASPVPEDTLEPAPTATMEWISSMMRMLYNPAEESSLPA